MRKIYSSRESSEQSQLTKSTYAQVTRDKNYIRSPALTALNELKKPYDMQGNEEQAKNITEQQKLNEDELDRTLPPRSVLFPSNYAKLTKIFYHVLVFLFFCLFIALLFWGRHIVTEGL